jgi:NAD(P)-dependent dehydrogenase (short-subunit alcohol dehydrogenase family)
VPGGRFDGRTVLITGAAGGQGRAHAVAFAGEGARLALCDVADLSETAELVGERCAKAVLGHVDAREYGEMEVFAERAVAEFGAIDVLVANAGIFTHGRLIDLSEDEFRLVIDVNLIGAWRAVKAVVPKMIERGYGRVVLVGSIGSLVGAPMYGHYAASKHGLIGLTRTLALEHAADGITVNIVCPGAVETPMLTGERALRDASPDDPTIEAVAEMYRQANPIPVPWMDPADVSNVVLFAASEENRYMTGSVLTIDLGYTAR